MNMDEAILNAFPLLAMPRTGDIPAATQAGMRYLVGNNGLWREVNLPWIRLVSPIVTCHGGIQPPYGEVETICDIKCSPVPMEMIRRFGHEARQASPTEIAGALIWNETDNSWRYARRNARSSSGAHIVYDEVKLLDGEHLVVDMHSHGEFAAYFSKEDDLDDDGTMRFSLVIGSLGDQRVSSALRLCMAGLLLRASIDEVGHLEVLP
jgi:PRTRC genetic system protein A